MHFLSEAVKQQNYHEIFSFLSQELLKHKLTCFPNPAVGCLIHTSDDQIVTGFHRYAGQAHAEIDAINNLKARYGEDRAKLMLKGATVYVTLEPCSHYGRTPPCCDTLIELEIGKCVVGDFDPTLKVNGKGIALMRNAGITVEVLNLEFLDSVNRDFKQLDQVKNQANALPYTRVKIAASLDNYVALNNGNSQWISNSNSREVVQLMRLRSQAILTSATTVNLDKARYNVRMNEIKQLDLAKFNDELLVQPQVVILDNSCQLIADQPIFTTSARKIILSQQPHPLLKQLLGCGKVGILKVTVPENVTIRDHDVTKDRELGDNLKSVHDDSTIASWSFELQYYLPLDGVANSDAVIDSELLDDASKDSGSKVSFVDATDSETIRNFLANSASKSIQQRVSNACISVPSTTSTDNVPFSSLQHPSHHSSCNCCAVATTAPKHLDGEVIFIQSNLDTHSKIGMTQLLLLLKNMFGVNDLLVETGGKLTSSIIGYNLYDEIHMIVAPVLLGTGRRALDFDGGYTKVTQCPRFRSYHFDVAGDRHVIYLNETKS